MYVFTFLAAPIELLGKRLKREDCKLRNNI